MKSERAGTARAGTRRAWRMPAWLTGPVLVLGVASFFADVSSELVYPIVPLFLTGTLGAPVLAVGVIEGVAEGTANLTKLFTGPWADRVGARKPFIVAGYGLAMVGKLIVGLAIVWPVALVGRSVDRFGKGIRTAPRDALLADASEEATRGKVFGFHRAMDTTGAVIGPLLGLLFLAVLAHRLRLIILLAAIPGFVSLAALYWLPESRPPAPAETDVDERRGTLAGLPAPFLLLLGATIIFMAGNSSDAFLILRARDLGLTTTLVIVAYIAYNAVYGALSFPAGAISDRIPREWLLVVGYGVFAGVYGGFALAGSRAAVWPLFIIYGAYIALTDGVSKALVADLAPPDRRSTAMGLFQGASGLAALAASVIAGLLWEFVAPAAPFALGAACALLAAATVAVLSLRGMLRPIGAR
ncbi:MAG: MFS transporter [Chloroflexi bacterium]|nr:MFS transporter [Chloroflexota bacterium]